MSFYSEESDFEDLPINEAVEEASVRCWVEELNSESPNIGTEYQNTAEYVAEL